MTRSMRLQFGLGLALALALMVAIGSATAQASGGDYCRAKGLIPMDHRSTQVLGEGWLGAGGYSWENLAGFSDEQATCVLGGNPVPARVAVGGLEIYREAGCDNSEIRFGISIDTETGGHSEGYLRSTLVAGDGPLANLNGYPIFAPQAAWPGTLEILATGQQTAQGTISFSSTPVDEPQFVALHPEVQDDIQRNATCIKSHYGDFWTARGCSYCDWYAGWRFADLVVEYVEGNRNQS